MSRGDPVDRPKSNGHLQIASFVTETCVEPIKELHKQKEDNNLNYQVQRLIFNQVCL